MEVLLIALGVVAGLVLLLAVVAARRQRRSSARSGRRESATIVDEARAEAKLSLHRRNDGPGAGP